MKYVDICQELDEETYIYCFNQELDFLKEVNYIVLEENASIKNLSQKKVKRYMFEEGDEEKLFAIITKKENFVKINMAYIKDDKFNILLKNRQLLFDIYDSEKIKKFGCSTIPNKNVFIISLENGEILKNKLDFIGEKEYIELGENKNYLVIQLRKSNEKFFAIGICRFDNIDKKYEAIIEEKGAKKIDIVEEFKPEKIYDKDNYVSFNIKNTQREIEK